MRNKLVLFLLVLLTLCSSQLYSQKPYVILVSLDGFRWDYRERGITPHLDSIASNGVSALSLKPVFPSTTFPNHTSIITGLYAENHGIISNQFENQFTGDKYSYKEPESSKDPKWYLGEAFWTTAKRYGIKTASYFWPGSELSDENRRPDYYMKYNHSTPYNDRVDGVIKWLKMPDSERPHFITLYMHETDSEGHLSGPDSDNINHAIMVVDSVIGYLADKINKLPIADSVNLIIVSDHGMAQLSPDRQINMNKLLNCPDCRVQNHGAYMTVLPPKGKTEQVFNNLKTGRDHYSVYSKGKIPKALHYSDNPLIWDILIIANTGWSLTYGEKTDYMKSLMGSHGYDNNDLRMHGIMVASGHAFKKDYKTGTLNAIDIYPLLCKLLGIEVPNNIDGKLDRIGFLLKD